MQSTSDITAKNTEYPVNLMYPFLYPPQRNDEVRTADWCAALSDATSSVEGTDPPSEESDQAQLTNEELIYHKYELSFLSSLSPFSLSLSLPRSPSADCRHEKSGSFDPAIAKPDELGLHSSFTIPMPDPQIGFMTLPEPNFVVASPMQSILEFGVPLHTFPSAFPSTFPSNLPSTFPSPVPRAFDSNMFASPTTCYNDNTPTAVLELSGKQRHFNPALHHNNSHEPSAYRSPHTRSTSSNQRGSCATNSIMSAPPPNRPSDPPHPHPPPPARPPTLQTPSPIIVGGGPGHMFRCAKEQLEFDISQHRSPQQPPCITDAMKV